MTKKTTTISPKFQGVQVLWENIEPFYQELLALEIDSLQTLENWMLQRSDLEAFLQEDYAWRYIRMTCFTEDKAAYDAFEYFATAVEPQMATYANQLDEKLYRSDYRTQLDPEKYRVYLRKVEKEIELFRESNVPILAQLQVEQQKYQSITGSFSIQYNGEELTFTQAAVFLKSLDRGVREEVWKKMSAHRLRYRDELDQLLNDLIPLRHQVALNAGFENYRDYMFQSLGRFDYNVKDCEDFHQAIEKHVVPVLKEFAEIRKSALQLDSVKPWDTEVDITGKAPLNPFTTSEELIDKTYTCFSRLHPEIGTCISIMKEKGLFDIDSRKGKAPGGYNYPLAATGMPFIFMHAAGTFSDMTTMLHEGGHALHTFESAHLTINDFKDVPSEVAELASMGMELISMEHWGVFFEDSESLNRAKREQLIDCLKTLPWVATVDCFQHWLYLHPNHTAKERSEAWLKIFDRFGQGFCDWTDIELAKANNWQKQLHIFEVPFYYIEYGMAQLGAVALWKNYLEDPQKTLEQYRAALRLGYTKTIPEIYSTAGIRFDFSASYVQELISFVKQQLDSIPE